MGHRIFLPGLANGRGDARVVDVSPMMTVTVKALAFNMPAQVENIWRKTDPSDAHGLGTGMS
jgi:hypothetical protein